MPFDPKQFVTRDPMAGFFNTNVDLLMYRWGAEPLTKPTRWHRIRMKARYTSLRAREWIARKVLRLDLGDDD